MSAGQRKTAYALLANVQLLIERHGINRIGFLTLTFARHVVAFKQAQEALHSLMTGVLKRRYQKYIVVMERMTSGRIHYHLLVLLSEDIRTGFDFAAVESGKYQSASRFLRNKWKFWLATASNYGFGRTELKPIKGTSAGVARYLAKYISKHLAKRLPEDKGARLVRYSKGTNRVGHLLHLGQQGGAALALQTRGVLQVVRTDRGLLQGPPQGMVRRELDSPPLPDHRGDPSTRVTHRRGVPGVPSYRPAGCPGRTGQTPKAAKTQGGRGGARARDRSEPIDRVVSWLEMTSREKEEP